MHNIYENKDTILLLDTIYHGGNKILTLQGVKKQVKIGDFCYNLKKGALSRVFFNIVKIRPTKLFEKKVMAFFR